MHLNQKGKLEQNPSQGKQNMWYRSSLNNYNEEINQILLKFCQEIDEIQTNDTDGDSELLKRLGPSFIKMVRGVFNVIKKTSPIYQLPIDAMFRYLSGKGEDFELSIDHFSREMRVYFLNAILEKTGNVRFLSESYDDNDDIESGNLQENSEIGYLFDYTDYSNLNQNQSTQDTFGNKTKKDDFDPLRYTIGGFTVYVWYNVEDNGDIVVYAKMEDRYDWDQSSGIEIDLDTFKIPSWMSGGILKKLKKLNNMSLKVNSVPSSGDNVLYIGDGFL